jgi:hypothetical protein
MATKVQNDKGFLVIETTMTETLKFGGCAICDSCNLADSKGYFIAALNSWYCPVCYNEWLAKATRYKEDIPIEERNYSRASKLLGIDEP